MDVRAASGHHRLDVAKIAVRLTPRGGRDAIEGWATDAAGRAYLKVRVSAPPGGG